MATVNDLYTGGIGADLDSQDEILKEFYVAEIREQMNRGTTTYNLLQRHDRNISGRRIQLAMHVAGSQATHAVQAKGQIPEARSQEYLNATLGWKRVVHPILIDSDLMAASRDEDGAWMQALESEIVHGVADLKSRANNMLLRDGSGRVGIVSAIGSAASGVITVKHPFDRADNSSFAAAGGLPTDLTVGTYVGIVNASYNASAGEAQFLHTASSGLIRHFKIIAANRSAGTITLSADGTNTVDLTGLEVATNTAHGIAAGDYVVLYRGGKVADTSEYSTDDLFHKMTNYRTTSSSNANTGSKDIMGLFGLAAASDIFDHIDTGTAAVAPLQGVDADTYPIWQGNKLNSTSAGVTLTVDMLDELGDTQEEVGQSEEWLFLTSRKDRRRYARLIDDGIRYTDLKIGDGMFEALVVHGRPILVDKDFPVTNWLALDLSQIDINMMEDLNWDDRDGHILTRLQKYLAYEARMVLRAELSTSRRNAISWLPNVTG